MGKGKYNKHIRIALFFVCLFLTGITGKVCAQDTIPEITPVDTIVDMNNPAHSTDNPIFYDTIPPIDDPAMIANDSAIVITYDDSSFSQNNDSIILITTIKDATSFKPNPKTAYLVAMVFPGFGQVYNRQYWKLPIIYGGLMGCAYAITWNNKTYQDYKEAYFDIMADAKNDPNGENPDGWHTSWQEFLSSTRNPADYIHNSNFQSQLKRGKDNFRRYRDLSIIVTGLVYLLCVADSYVDAQMFDFDVSPDLSFRVTPEFRPETLSTSRSYGFNVCMTF